MADRDGVRPRRDRDRHRRAHAGRGRVVDGALVDTPVRLLDQRGDPLVARRSGRRPRLERRRGELRGDLARLRPAHPVGDGEQRRRDDEVSSLRRRFRPVSVAAGVLASCMPPPIGLEPQVGLADRGGRRPARAAVRASSRLAVDVACRSSSRDPGPRRRRGAARSARAVRRRSRRRRGRGRSRRPGRPSAAPSRRRNSSPASKLGLCYDDEPRGARAARRPAPRPTARGLRRGPRIMLSPAAARSSRAAVRTIRQMKR